MAGDLDGVFEVELGDGKSAAGDFDRRRASEVIVKELGIQRRAHEYNFDWAPLQKVPQHLSRANTGVPTSGEEAARVGNTPPSPWPRPQQFMHLP